MPDARRDADSLNHCRPAATLADPAHFLVDRRGLDDLSQGNNQRFTTPADPT